MSSALFILGLTLSLACLEPALARADKAPDPDAAAELMALKDDFIKKMSRENDPEELMALAAYFAGRSWEIAAQRIAEQYPTPRAEEYLNRINIQDFEEAMKKARQDPVQRQILGLKLLYRSLNAVAVILAANRGDKVTLVQIQALEKQIDQSIEAGDETMKVMVPLTRGIMTMLVLSLRSMDTGQKFLNQVNNELKFRVQEAKAIKARSDIHYYAKLFLWTINNINGSFKMICFFNLAADERLAVEVNPVREALERHLRENDSPIRTMTLGLTAVAEAGFPVLTALVRR